MTTKKTLSSNSRRYWAAVRQRLRPRVLVEAGAYSVAFAILWLQPLLSPLTYGTLDPSFIYGIEKAGLERLSFGSQFIATYGPFGYAVSNFLPENIGRTMVWQLLAVLFAGIGVYLFLKVYCRKLHGYRRWITGLLLLLALSLGKPEWLYLNLFLLYVFIYLKLKGRAKLYAAYSLAAAAAILMLVKFTGGAAATGALVFAVFLSGIETEGWRKKLGVLARTLLVYFVTLIGLGLILGTTNIFAYLLASFRMSNGFNNAMSYVTPHIAISAQYAAAAFLVFAVWVIYKCRRSALQYTFLLPVFYIVWKYSIVRLDGHILALLALLPALGLMFLLSQYRRLSLIDGVALAIILPCIILAGWAANLDYPVFQAALANPLNNVRNHGVVHFFRTSNQKTAWRAQTITGLQSGILPLTMQQTIGHHGVDIFPWEADVVAANGLNWQNRPSPFAFESYTPQFDAANAKYIEQHGPDFIVWHGFSIDGVSGIDGRTDLWDEPQTLKAILANYTYVEHNKDFILLKRNSQPTQKPNITAKETFTEIGKGSVKVPQSNGLVCMDVSIKDNTAEKLKTFAVRQRPFYIHLVYADGTNRELRFIRETASDGMLVSDLPRSWDQLVELLQYHKSADQVDRFAVIAEPTTKVAFHNCLTGKQ